MQELDLEEIESRLYGQVFHSIPEDCSSIPSDLIQNVNIMNVPQRQVSNFSISNVIPQKSRYWNVNRPQQVQVINNDFLPTSNGDYENLKSKTVIVNNQIPVHIPQSNNDKEELRVLRRQRRKEKRKRKRQFKLQEKYKNLNKWDKCLDTVACICNKTNQNVTIQNKSNDNTNITSKPNLSVAQNEKDVNNFVDMGPFHAISKFENRIVQNDVKTTIDTIVVSDSDSDDVQYVEQPEKPVYVVESDSDSSVIIDEVEDNKEVTQLNQSKENIENNIVSDSKFGNLLNKNENITTDQNIVINEEVNNDKNINKDCSEVPEVPPSKLNDEKISSSCLKPLISEVEITCTPDSTNDFIDSDVHTDKQFRFNFSLHGSDLDLTEKEITNNPKITTPDLFETESSCSEQGTPTKKSYTELQSNAPKDIFQEEDLCSFSNFITPNREDKKRKSIDVNEQIPTKALKLFNKHTDKQKTTPNINEDDSVTKKIVPKRYLIKQKNEIIERLNKYELKVKELEEAREKKSIKKRKKKHLKKIIFFKKRMVCWTEQLRIVEQKICGKYNNDYNPEIETKEIEQNDLIVNIKSNNVNLEDVPVTNETENIKIDVNLKDDNMEEVLNDLIKTVEVEKLNQAVVIVCSDSDNDIDSKKDEDRSEKYFVDDSSDDCSDTNDFTEQKDLVDTSGVKSSDIVLNISPVKLNEPSTSAQATINENENMVKNPFYEGNHKKNFSDFWTDDMDEFYDKSWGQEDYDINEVIKSMPSDPDKWKIIDDDKNIFKKPNKRKFCMFCRRDGHMMYDCPKLNNKEAIKCSLCGDEGHMRTRCPNQMCLTCGNKEGYLTTSCRKCQHYKRIKCNICKMMGHPQNICPDLWRRYHLSLNEKEKPVAAASKLKPHKDQWCSGCAQRGHLYHECRNIIRDHHQILPFVVNYNESYTGKNEDQPTAEPRRPRSRNFENMQNSSSNSRWSPRVDFGNNKQGALKASHRNKYGWLVKKLLQECGNHMPEYLQQLKMLDYELRHNDDFSPHIGTLFRLKNLIRKHRDA